MSKSWLVTPMLNNWLYHLTGNETHYRMLTKAILVLYKDTIDDTQETNSLSPLLFINHSYFHIW